MKEENRRAEIAEAVFLALPDWFGMPEGTRAYIDQCRVQPLWAAFVGDQPVGFASLSQTNWAAAEIHCMGVLPGLHRQGIGRGLMEALTAHAMQAGYRLLLVKMVDAGHHPEYDRTIAFYDGMGFLRLEVFPTLWDERNPCLVLVKAFGT